MLDGLSQEKPDSNLTQATNLPLKQIEPGIFELGKVRLDKNKGNIQFPASLNMNQGVIEYLIVTGMGKLHESLLRTEAEPYQIHLAMLLVGAKGAPTNSVSDDPAMAGDSVTIYLAWKSGKIDKRSRAEDLVFNIGAKQMMTRGSWTYNGSRVIAGNFIAQRDGSIVSLIVDPDALINNPRPGRENDELWQIKSNGLPPLNTLFQVTIQLEKAAAKP